MRQVMFLFWTAIVCYWTSQPTVLVFSMTLPEERPVVFPDEDILSNQHEAKNLSVPTVEVPTATVEAAENHLGIPEKLLIEMSKVQDLAGLLDFLGTNGSGIDAALNTTVGRKKLSPGSNLSRIAGCEPELQTVELEKPKDASHVYWPMCVRVPRCGGCCTSSLLACVPVKKTNTEARVLHARYLGKETGGEFEIKEFKAIPVEKHQKCSCRCREQPEDCTELQVYKEEECKCVCKDKEAMVKCTGANWIWDPRECACKCRKTEECSSGFFYNSQSCRCEAGRSSLIGKRLPKTNNANDTLEPDSAELVSHEDSSSTSELPTTIEPPSTTTTKRPSQRTLSRKARPLHGQQAKPEPPISVLISSTDEDATPFALQNSKGEQDRARRVPTVKDRNK